MALDLHKKIEKRGGKKRHRFSQDPLQLPLSLPQARPKWILRQPWTRKGQGLGVLRRSSAKGFEPLMKYFEVASSKALDSLNAPTTSLVTFSFLASHASFRLSKDLWSMVAPTFSPSSWSWTSSRVASSPLAHSRFQRVSSPVPIDQH